MSQLSVLERELLLLLDSCGMADVFYDYWHDSYIVVYYTTDDYVYLYGSGVHFYPYSPNSPIELGFVFICAL